MMEAPSLREFAFSVRNGPIGADVGPACVKCQTTTPLVFHHIIYAPPRGATLCEKCHRNVTSLNACSGLANKGKLDNEQREFLWQWFLNTDYFKTHKRFSRGRAKRLLQRDVGVGLSVNPANGSLTGDTIQVADGPTSTSDPRHQPY